MANGELSICRKQLSSINALRAKQEIPAIAKELKQPVCGGLKENGSQSE